MLVYDNCIYRDATSKEIAVWKQETAQQPTDLSLEERIAILEKELKAAKILLGLDK